MRQSDASAHAHCLALCRSKSVPTYICGIVEFSQHVVVGQLSWLWDLYPGGYIMLLRR